VGGQPKMPIVASIVYGLNDSQCSRLNERTEASVDIILNFVLNYGEENGLFSSSVSLVRILNRFPSCAVPFGFEWKCANGSAVEFKLEESKGKRLAGSGFWATSRKIDNAKVQNHVIKQAWPK
jgi:hypothetical protein